MNRASEVFDYVTEHAGPLVRAVRGRGCLIGLELDGPAAPVRADLLNRGIITGSADDPNVIRLMPPLNVPLDDLADFTAALAMSLDVVDA